jgi:hypothetical protein
VETKINELTREEKERIYSRAAIPMLLFSFICAIYMIFFSEVTQMESLLDVMNYIFPVVLFPMVTIFLLSVEILCTRENRELFHLRHLISRIAFTGGFQSMYLLAMNVSHFFLSPLIPPIYTFAIAFFVTSWIIYKMFKIPKLKEIFDKLTGEW